MSGDPEYLATMGQIAHYARQLVGGRDINGFPYSPATIENARPLVLKLRDLLDEYDRQMMDEARRKNADENAES